MEKKKKCNLTLQPSTPPPVNTGSQCPTHCDPARVYYAIIYDDIIANNTGSYTNSETLRADIYGVGFEYWRFKGTSKLGRNWQVKGLSNSLFSGQLALGFGKKNVSISDQFIITSCWCDKHKTHFISTAYHQNKL